MLRQGQAGTAINLIVKFFVNGVLFDPFNVASVKIFDDPVAGTLLDELTPIRISIGLYQVIFNIPSNLTPASYYDQWEWTAEAVMSSKIQRNIFDVLPFEAPPVPAPEPVSVEVACRSHPSWAHRIGLIRTEDMGNGMGVRLYWEDAIPSDPVKLIHYNIYYADNRLDVLSTWPKLITTDKIVIANVQPGNQQYFTVKATEFNTTDFDLTQLVQTGSNVFQYPADQILLADIDAYAASIQVADTSEYPEKGFLLLDVEVIKYSHKDATFFYVEDTDRGAFTTRISSHEAGTVIKLFRGIEDGNSVIVAGTAAWHNINPRNVDAVGQFNVAPDGYRENKDDIVTTNLTASDTNTEDFPYYDFQGYHRPSLQDSFSGKCVGSYLGGDFNGSRGFIFEDRILS